MAMAYAQNNPKRVLKKYMEAAWSSPEFERLVSGYESATQGTFAACLKEAMDSGTAGVDAYKRCAKQANLSQDLKSLW